jgi:2-dehydro-3-deoxyphosphogalactonate aldolase
MTAILRFKRHLTQCPLIAILRGITQTEAEEIGAALIEAGLRIIEVPLNSPEPLATIERLARLYDGHATIGAGTVLTIDQVKAVKNAGGELIVSPNTNPKVIEASVTAGLVSCPGYFTPSEAFQAIASKAHALKLFPADAASPALLKAHRAVLPSDIPVLVVGGVTPESIPDWREAGAMGFGIASNLFKPGYSVDEVAARARSLVEASL